MEHRVAFYFDFLSPYAYLGSVGIERLSLKYCFEVDWRPILLGISVIKVMGLKGVADTPLKRDYVRHDVERSARYMDIRFKRASERTMNPLPAARAFVWLDSQDKAIARQFGRLVFNAQWAEGRDMSRSEAVCELAPLAGVDPARMEAAIADPAIKRLLAERVDGAIAAGVFGAPTFAVDGELFWGADRLPMVERWIETGGW